VRILAIINLRSGQGDAGLYDYIRTLGRNGAQICLRFVDRETHIHDLLHDAKTYDCIVAAGGDGTVSSVCYAARNTGVPILTYPAGTANLLAQNLKMPFDPIKLANITLECASIPVDIGELSCPGDSTGCDAPGAEEGSSGLRTGFVVMAGAGFDAMIMEGAQPLKKTIGAAAYLVSAVQNLNPTVADFKLTLDGKVVETKGIAVLLANFTRLQFDLSFTKDSSPSDGMLEVIVLRSKNVAEYIPAVWAAILDRVMDHPDRSKNIEIHTASDIIIESNPPLSLQYDGEVIDASTPLHVRVLPGAARLILPPNSSLLP
jgi:diacylglycerol kinase family enzyme